MLPEDQSKFLANRQWFNHFFGDIRQLIYDIHQALVSELGYKIIQRGWYYEKSNHVPSLPPYWLIGISEPEFSLQIYLILDTSLLEGHPVFTPDLSFVFIKHNHAGRWLYTEEGMSVIKNQGITLTVHQGRYASGDVIKNGSVFAKYQAFQAPLHLFTIGKDIRQVILDNIVSVLREMPEL